MKNIIYLLMPCVALSIFSSSCADPAKNLTINPDFIANPPDISDINTEIIGDQFKITSRIAEEKTLYHVFNAGEEKLVLRDDGRKGDDKKKDGIFSLMINATADEVKGIIVNRMEELKNLASKNTNLFRFEGRHAVPFNPQLIPELENTLKSKINFELPDFIFEPIGGNVTATKASHSLLINDPLVVEDTNFTFNPCTGVGNPDGPWTFKTLMTNMANESSTGVTPANLTKTWLKEWLVDKIINGDVVSNRANGLWSQLLKSWIERSNTGLTLPTNPPNIQKILFLDSFDINLDLAPFKLLAIVNRMDLGGTLRYGAMSGAGEGRFVFGAMNIDPSNPVGVCFPLQFTVIFEYGLPLNTCTEIKDYAQLWQNLSTKVIGSIDYDTSLILITNRFSRANGCPSKALGSCLNQLRTNEISLSSPWELREFTISDSTQRLVQRVVSQEPAKKFNRIASPPAADLSVLSNYVNTNESDIKKDKHVVPFILSGNSFLGSKSHTETPSHFWDADIAGVNRISNDTARHHFSLNTCSGCHGGETNTFFTHISPTSFGGVAPTSGFLNGVSVNDIAGRTPNVWNFNDLLRRQIDLDIKANAKCKKPDISDILRAIKFKRIRMVH